MCYRENKFMCWRYLHYTCEFISVSNLLCLLITKWSIVYISWTFTGTCVNAPTHARSGAHTRTCTHTHTGMQTHIHVLKHKSTHTHTHTHTHTLWTCVLAHTHTHAHMYIVIRACASNESLHSGNLKHQIPLHLYIIAGTTKYYICVIYGCACMCKRWKCLFP